MPGTQETCRLKPQTYQQTTMTHTIDLHSVQLQGPVSFHHGNVFHALMHILSTPFHHQHFFFFFSMVYSIRYLEVYQVALTLQKQVSEPQTKWVQQASKQATPLLRSTRGKWITISGSNLRPTSLKLPPRMPHESTETGCQQPRQHA